MECSSNGYTPFLFAVFSTNACFLWIFSLSYASDRTVCACLEV